MTPEEYERIKAAEKEHLRALQKLKKTLRQARRRQSAGKALGEIARAPDALDESAALIEKLAAETARYEARLDLALENTPQDDTDAPGGLPLGEDEASEEAARRQARARALLRQLKEEVQEAALPSAPQKGTPAPPPAPLPEKTIGRMDDGEAAAS